MQPLSFYHQTYNHIKIIRQYIMIRYQISELLNLQHDKKFNIHLKDLDRSTKGIRCDFLNSTSSSSTSTNFAANNSNHHLQPPIQFKPNRGNTNNTSGPFIRNFSNNKSPFQKHGGNSKFSQWLPVSNSVSIHGLDNNSGNRSFQGQNGSSYWKEMDNNYIDGGKEKGNYVYLPVSPSYRLVQIPPGMPIPNDAIPAAINHPPIQIPLVRRIYQNKLDLGYSQTTSPTTITTSTTTTTTTTNKKELSAIEKVRLEFKQNLLETAALKVKQKYQEKSKKVKFVYDPKKAPKVDNPYSISGFFPSSMINSGKTDQAYSVFNSNELSDENDSYNQSTIGSSYDVQIQLPVNF
ncbi:hypothetical protein DFJ63DRAFT_311281 [Scheffersomyces coipomensis]|uniref:uncharacterized protein n=1 Tax=Scheffersomyces coipomensis TaxID=1788519 RepID=UPI00315C5161